MHRASDSRYRPVVTAVAAVGLAAAVSFAAALPAFAHTVLVSSTPAEGALVDEPTLVELVFSEALLDVGGEMSVVGADGVVTSLVVTYPAPDVATATLPALAAGTAAVSWRVVASDGHPVEGTLTFVVAAPPSAEPSEDPEPVPEPQPAVTPSPSVSASVELAVTPISAEPEAAGGIPAWLWAALVSVVVGATCVAMATSKRR